LLLTYVSGLIQLDYLSVLLFYVVLQTVNHSKRSHSQNASFSETKNITASSSTNCGKIEIA